MDDEDGGDYGHDDNGNDIIGDNDNSNKAPVITTGTKAIMLMILVSDNKNDNSSNEISSDAPSLVSIATIIIIVVGMMLMEI